MNAPRIPLFSALLTALCLTAPTLAQQGPKKLDPNAYDHFGAGIAGDAKALTIADVMKEPAKYTGKKIRLTGPITSVCQKKGCWMHLGKPLANGNPPVFVKFKDYAFFMPKDASGRTAIVEGVLAVKQETVAETRHYLEDAGKHDEAKKVTEGRKLLSFMADGAALSKPAKKAEKAAAPKK